MTKEEILHFSEIRSRFYDCEAWQGLVHITFLWKLFRSSKFSFCLVLETALTELRDTIDQSAQRIFEHAPHNHVESGRSSWKIYISLFERRTLNQAEEV